MRGALAATILPTRPPSLWPTSPMRSASMSGRLRRRASAAWTSETKSRLVALAKSPPEWPRPRLSLRSTAKPRRVRSSASTR